MKILILANYDIGLYQFRRELIEKLLEENEVHISLPRGTLVEKLCQMGCHFWDTPVDRRGMNPGTDMRLLRRYMKLLSSVKPDMVITYTIKPNIYGGFCCRIKRVPYAVNITGLGTAFQKKGMLRATVTMMYKIALKRAKVVFFENASNRDLFTDSHIVSGKQTCLLNGAGINLDYFKYMEYPHNEETVFLYIGRIMREKGIDELLDAMQRLMEEGVRCRLEMVGPSEENYDHTLRKCEEAGWLKYHGYQEDVRPFICSADCFVLPSWHEGMANTNLECAASGRPVITSDIPGCREAVIDHVSGFLCKSRNSESLHRVMKKFLALSENDRREMGLEGRKHMEDVFDKRTVVAQTVDRLFKGMR